MWIFLSGCIHVYLIVLAEKSIAERSWRRCCLRSQGCPEKLRFPLIPTSRKWQSLLDRSIPRIQGTSNCRACWNRSLQYGKNPILSFPVINASSCVPFPPFIWWTLSQSNFRKTYLVPDSKLQVANEGTHPQANFLLQSWAVFWAESTQHWNLQ